MDYSDLLNSLTKLRQNFDIKVIGKTTFGRNIFAVERNLSSDFFTAFFVASTHAREHITTDLVIEMAERGLFDQIKNFNVCIIPMLNPDGVELSIHGISSAPESYKKFLLEINGGADFSLWKANGRGVDINNNFDANFGQNRGALQPAPSGYSGKFPESEPETKALACAVREKRSFLAVTYHSKGEEIYYNFFQEGERLQRDSEIANLFCNSTGYPAVNVENSSSGGFKDFCVQNLKIPALTIEVGSDRLSHPISAEHLPEIYAKHQGDIDCATQAYEIWKRFKI